MNLKYISILIFSLSTLSLWGQYVPSPGATQSQGILITGATAHLGNGDVIKNAYIAFDKGKFTVVNTQAVAQGFDNYKKIDATGKHVYPGVIAMNSTLGLNEIGAVRATHDYREVGGYNTNVRSIIAYNTDSEVIPTVRSNGALMAQITPEGGRISGQSTLVSLDAWNWEDAALKTDEGMHLNWPRLFRFTGWWAEPGGIKKNEEYSAQIAELETLFQEAYAYTQKDAVDEKNLKFEAMKGLFDGSKRLYIHTNAAKTMEAGILFAKKHNITPVIIGGEESWLITDFLKENDIAVVLSSTQSLPRYQDSAIDQPYKTPALLQEAGVKWCFSHGEYWSQRNLLFTAGQAVGFGLDYEAAITALTLSPAQMIGVDTKMGTLEIGKDATLLICEGDILDMRSSRISQAFIQGREVDLNNKHEILNEKFSNKYKQ